MTEKDINNLEAALEEIGATVEKNGEHLRATFTDPLIDVGIIRFALTEIPGDRLVIYYDQFGIPIIDPAAFGYKIFGNTGDIGNGKRIIILSPVDFQ